MTDQILSGEKVEVATDDICKMYEAAYKAKNAAHSAQLLASHNREESMNSFLEQYTRAGNLLNSVNNAVEQADAAFSLATELHRQFCNYASDLCQSFNDKEILRNSGLDFHVSDADLPLLKWRGYSI